MEIIKPEVQLEWITPNAEYQIEMACRTCYKSEGLYDPVKSETFLDKVINQNHHESVMEHGVASFRIITDRGITHEIVRHRLASYSQESTRYVNYAKDRHGAGSLRFILPLGLTPEQKLFALEAYEQEERIYNRAIELGMSAQQARDFLPNGIKTEIVMTANFREWQHFIRLRTSPAAHPKMRVVAGMIQDILASRCPIIFKKGAENVSAL